VHVHDDHGEKKHLSMKLSQWLVRPELLGNDIAVCILAPVDTRNGGELPMPQTDTDTLCEVFDLAPRAASAAEARHRALAWLFQHSVDQQAAEAAVLIVSELVTNAVVHSRSDVIRCALGLGSGLLRIEVTDQGADLAEPAVRTPAADDTSGRGLLLVSVVSEAWGVCLADAGGRTVWATLRMAEECR
jgi:anti-sigma regulatory factor (Ser/Thr protein kinase)